MWVANEGMTALGTANAADETGAPEGRQELIEVGLRDRLAAGDDGALHRALAVMVRQLYEGAYTVIALHRDLHSFSVMLSGFVNNYRHGPEAETRVGTIFFTVPKADALVSTGGLSSPQRWERDY
jgi:hypothetical protein